MELKRNEHGTITGMSQSGKSYFAKYIFPMYPRAIFYDLKHDPNHAELVRRYPVATSPKKLSELFRRGATHIVYRPPPAPNLKGAMRHFDHVARFCFEKGNIALFVDEAANLCTDRLISPNHYKLITMGMSRGAAVIHCTQKPVYVNNSIYSEAVWHVLFKLKVKGHRKKIAGVVGDEIAEQLRTIEKYHFIFVQEDGEYFKDKLPAPEE